MSTALPENVFFNRNRKKLQKSGENEEERDVEIDATYETKGTKQEQE